MRETRTAAVVMFPLYPIIALHDGATTVAVFASTERNYAMVHYAGVIVNIRHAHWVKQIPLDCMSLSQTLHQNSVTIVPTHGIG